MKAICERKSLCEALDKTRLCLSKTLPILSYIRVGPQDSCLFFTATNLEQTIRTKCKAEIEGEKKDFCIPGEKFFSIVKELSSNRVELFLGKTLQVRSGRSKFSLTIGDVEEFPKVDIPKFKERIDLLGFIRRLKKVFFCTARKDYSREVLMSILVGKYIVATDGSRLACIPDKEWKEKDIIIPQNFVSILEKIGENQEGMYTVDDNRFIVKFGDTICMTQLTDGKFPDWKDIMPKKEDMDKVYILDKNAFERAVRRVSLMSEKETRIVRLSFRDNRLFLSSFSAEGMGEEEVEVEGDKELEIGFNAVYLLEGLKRVDGEKVVMTCEGPTHPVLFEPQDNTEWKYLLMPVVLKEE